MKVLFGVDGSAGSFASVKFGGRLLSAASDQAGFYFTPPAISPASGEELEPAVIERARVALSDAVFAEAKSHLPPDLAKKVHTIVGTQPPRSGLLVAADEWRADMLVVGARGVGPLKKLLIGSVSSAVAQAATIPVLVARPPAGKSREGLRVLLASDGSEASRHAAEVVSRLSFPPDAQGFSMSVVESMFGGELPEWLVNKVRCEETEAMAKSWLDEHDAEKRLARDNLAEFAARLPPAFRQSEPIVVEGNAAEQILKTIAAKQIDLVVLGAHGQGALARFLMGSTSTHVLNQAPCSVLVARMHEKP